ncbi:MAG: YeeE/YedE family protein [Oceanospirillaceae bacterium]|nr:YeeE/YedE family protein [Oceanospirillaceae bacterium]MCP5349792.1 YeeE/YedE family protein [Oceanospirillaceae bacterium]
MSELAGGALIGLAAAVLWLGLGRIAGITGILSRLFQRIDALWGWGFMAGLTGAYPLYVWLSGKTPELQITSSPVLLILAGLLVGVGTYISNGCTSGHGVCGTSRISVRSITATITFISAGVLTVALMHLGGLA